MTPQGMLRPADAVKRFNVARTTLIEWADRGWIGRSRIGRVTFYPAQDIADLIASHLGRRTVVPITTQSTTAPTTDDEWTEQFWAGAKGSGQ